MRRSGVLFFVVVILAGISVLAADQPLPTHKKPAQVTRQFGAQVDLRTGAVTAPDPHARGQVNNDFMQTGAYCVGCGTTCPPFPRTIVIELTAVTGVEPGYFVGDLLVNNSTMTLLEPSGKAPLTPGQTVTYSFTVDVLDCDSSFGVWFNMCQPGNPSAPEAACP
jgi:hypothetical protein